MLTLCDVKETKGSISLLVMGVDRITLVVTISTLGWTKPIPTSPWCRLVKTNRALVTVERAMLSDEKVLGFRLRGKKPTLEETY